MDQDEVDLPRVLITEARPRFTLLLLTIMDDDLKRGFERLLYEVKRLSLKARGSSSKELVADNIDYSSVDSDELFWINSEPYQTAAYIFREHCPPSWAKYGSLFVDTAHSLVILMRKGPLAAVHSDSKTLISAIQAWLDRSPRPRFRRISEGILNAAFLAEGEARSMWLRGVHAPRSTKANSKHLSGPRLQDALLHAVDGTFAMGAARALLPASEGLQSLRGIIGLTPRKSQIWHQQPVTPDIFFANVADVLNLIEGIAERGISLDNPYPVLCTHERDLAEVRGAFDISTLPRSDIQARGDADDDLLEAADRLEHAFIDVRAIGKSSSFHVDVGQNGAICGTLSGRIHVGAKSLSLRFGLHGEPTNPPPVRHILDDLNRYADDLVTIYYESGHTALMKAVYKQHRSAVVFPNWIWEDFAGFDISKEKPPVRSPQEIHDQIGSAADDSLFSWIARRFGDGWLTCDDGSGEVADFIHLSNDGILSLLHVKGAKLNHRNRKVAVGPYEVVISQAEKNVRYLTVDTLIKRLSQSPVDRPASWRFGERVDDRAELIEMLGTLDPRARTKVLVVQPHMSKRLYDEALGRREEETAASADTLRTELLEALLNIAHAGIVGNGSDLYVMGSLE
ncbi:hypothetical protein ACPXB1_08750 [Micromonospora sp. DT68]|uniref:hypothetical protein n=1 Tax=Micromonospora sp. DT68 TaxID=3416522 RepID=UPI003CF2E91B